MLTHDDDVSRDEDAAPTGKILPIAPRRTPDWLTGPSADPAAGPDEAPGSAPIPPPVLPRPGMPAANVEMEPGIESASASAFSAAAARAKAEPEAAPAAEPRPAKPRRVSDPSAPWAPRASSVPVPKLSLVEKPEKAPAAQVPAAPAVETRPRALPGRDEDLRPSSAAPPAPAPAPLAESWWVIVLDNLRMNRRAQLAVAAALAVLVALGAWMWPRGVGTTPLSRIRRHPAEFDGREVVVRGRVGDDVFAVGAGWAFYLMQGRDTIVAFSMTRMPEARKVLTLKGQVSTGFLDGRPRQALFEGSTPLSP